MSGREMAGFIKTKLSQKLFARTWKTVSWTRGKLHYSKKYSTKKFKNFEEIPVIQEENYSFADHDARTKRWFETYGPVATEYTRNGICLVHLYDPLDFNAIYQHDGKFVFRKSYWIHHLMGYRESRCSILDSIALGFNKNTEWWDLRNRMVGVVTEEVAEPFLPDLEEVADDLMEILYIKSNEGDGSIELLPLLFRWVLECVGVITFDFRLGALSGQGNENKTFVEALAILNCMVALTEKNLEDYDKWKSMSSERGVLYELIAKHSERIKRGRSVNSYECLLRRIINVHSNIPGMIYLMTFDLFMRDLQMMALILLMSLYNLARNYNVQNKARAVVGKLIPYRKDRYFNTVKGFNTLNTEYLHNILWETLRISPPIIGNGRELNDDVVLGGYVVPRGINVVLHHQVACMFEEYFENPLKFKPERYPCLDMVHLDYAFGGRRTMSLGREFAFSQMSLVLAKIIRIFSITYKGEEIKMTNRLYNQPQNPLFLKFDPLV